MDKHLKVVTMITDLLDNKFKIGGIKFGLDPILGIIPGFGDIVTLVLSLYMIWLASRMKIPDEEIGKMMKNLLFDVVIGAVPVIGDIGDVFYKANSRNLEIIKKYYGKKINDAELVT